MSNGNVAGLLGGLSRGLERRNQQRYQQQQEEQQRKDREAQQAETRKYYANQERRRKAEQRKYTEGLKAQATELTEQNRIKAVTPVAQSAEQYYAPYVQQGLMTPQDVQVATQHIMTQSGGDSAYDTMIAAGKRFEPAKPKAPAKPSADEKFNAVMQAYFTGQGEQLSPSQWNTFRKAMPANMKDIPLTPPEGVTSVGQLRNYMKEQNKQAKALEEQQGMTEEIDQAKRVWKAERAAEERKRAASDNPDEYVMLVPEFDKWIRQSDQIKKYGKASTFWRKQQLQDRIARAAGRSPSKEAGFDAYSIPGVPSGLSVPPATTPQETPQSVPAARPQTQTGQNVPNALDRALKSVMEAIRRGNNDKLDQVDIRKQLEESYQITAGEVSHVIRTARADPAVQQMIQQETPQSAPAGQSQGAATQSTPNLQDLSDEELLQLYKQLGGQ